MHVLCTVTAHLAVAYLPYDNKPLLIGLCCRTSSFNSYRACRANSDVCVRGRRMSSCNEVLPEFSTSLNRSLIQVHSSRFLNGYFLLAIVVVLDLHNGLPDVLGDNHDSLVRVH